jgi:hypothetical protein
MPDHVDFLGSIELPAFRACPSNSVKAVGFAEETLYHAAQVTRLVAYATREDTRVIHTLSRPDGATVEVRSHVPARHSRWA